MKLDIKNPIILSIMISITTFLIAFIFISIDKPSFVQKVDSKGNTYIDNKLTILYSILFAIFAGILVIIGKLQTKTTKKQNKYLVKQEFSFQNKNINNIDPSSILY